MGIFARRRDAEEPDGGGSGLSMELDELACPMCRRRLLPWEATCPEDGAAAVRLTDLAPRMAPPPAHLLADDEPREDAPEGAGPTD